MCYCGAECYLADDDNAQSCWGEIEVVDEITWEFDWSWIHACQGHEEMWDGSEYVKEQ